jgi:hypothetical protein
MTHRFEDRDPAAAIVVVGPNLVSAGIQTK